MQLAQTDFDLEVRSIEVNFTGARRPAVAVNGQVPGPLLVWPEGETITVRVKRFNDWLSRDGGKIALALVVLVGLALVGRGVVGLLSS